MRVRNATTLGALALTAAAALLTTGTAVADGRDSHDGRVGRLGEVGDVGYLGHFGRDGGRNGRDVGAVTIGKHTYAPSTASHNWGGNNWNSKVVFGDMNLD
ncbi:hypothetical protein A6A06_22780 [Streptomyces sp. CB02923]|uniref:hypothetical protein n=1 Tax=Streptomyces sp. CB02923 TaxID=1718985 RepID=UPI00093C45F1|nr:hypothetical protein [Streptomyces sp. CB02923]OKH99878.1 hypothetical protein A6A06_22780 [Streptomyces sp. CB02923]